MKRFLLLAIAVALVTGPVEASGTWLKSLPAAQKAAKAKNQLIFVDLYADWCGWCKRMEQDVFPSEKFQNATSKMVLLRLNTEDRADGTKFEMDYGVNSLPTFLVLTPDGMLAAELRGYAPPEQFVHSMDDMLGRYREFQKELKNEPAIAGDYQKRLSLAREFVQRHAEKEAEVRLRKLTEDAKTPAPIRNEAYYNLAITQVRQKRPDEALKTLQKFSKLENKGEFAERGHLLVGQIYLERGDLAAAAKEFRNFKTAYPQSQFNPGVDQVLAEIQQRGGGKF